MRYIMMVKSGKECESGAPPSPKLLSEMGLLNDEMAKAGVLLSCEGLKPSSYGTRLKYGGGQLTVTDGPFAETKELIGGFAILNANSKQEAIEFANRAVEVHIRAGIPEVEIEIRPLYETSDFLSQPCATE